MRARLIPIINLLQKSHDTFTRKIIDNIHFFINSIFLHYKLFIGAKFSIEHFQFHQLFLQMCVSTKSLLTFEKSLELNSDNQSVSLNLQDIWVELQKPLIEDFTKGRNPGGRTDHSMGLRSILPENTDQNKPELVDEILYIFCHHSSKHTVILSL